MPAPVVFANYFLNDLTVKNRFLFNFYQENSVTIWHQKSRDKVQEMRMYFKVLCYLQNEKIWSYKINYNTWLQKITTCIRLQAEEIVSVNIWCFCFQFRARPIRVFSSVMTLKSVSQIFKILFQTGDINIFVLCCVFFSRYVQLRSSFSNEKNSGEIWDTL